jgi:hypothetical protein
LQLKVRAPYLSRGLLWAMRLESCQFPQGGKLMKRTLKKIDSSRWTGHRSMIEAEVLYLVLLAGAIVFVIIASSVPG